MIPRYKPRLPMEQVPLPGLAKVPVLAGSKMGKMLIPPPSDEELAEAVGRSVGTPEPSMPLAVANSSAVALPGMGYGAPLAVAYGRLELLLGIGSEEDGAGKAGGAGAGAASVSWRWQAWREGAKKDPAQKACFWHAMQQLVASVVLRTSELAMGKPSLGRKTTRSK